MKLTTSTEKIPPAARYVWGDFLLHFHHIANEETSMKTIFLAESENHVREALHLMLDQRLEFIVGGEASTAESTLAQVCQHPPDVVLLDWGLPGLHPQRLLNALRQCYPHMLIIATSVRPELERVALDLGVDGFLLKQLPPDQYVAQLLDTMAQSDVHPPNRKKEKDSHAKR
jgi:DNA-binding NarL/FixJ family response regulator